MASGLGLLSDNGHLIIILDILDKDILDQIIGLWLSSSNGKIMIILDIIDKTMV